MINSNHESTSLATSTEWDPTEFPMNETRLTDGEGLSDEEKLPPGVFYMLNATCKEHEDPECIIDHNITCVGDPVYCNLTYEEYMQLLYDYIYPSVPEWILICSHALVFIMGLVSGISWGVVHCLTLSSYPAGGQRTSLHSRLHESHDAHGDQHLHREPGGGGLLCDSLLSASHRVVGRHGDVVHGESHVQGPHLLPGKGNHTL